MTKNNIAKSIVKANVDTMTAKVAKEIEKNKKLVEKEALKMKKSIESVTKQAEDFMKKNPEKSAAIAAGVGAALGAATALLFSAGAKKKGKK